MSDAAKLSQIQVPFIAFRVKSLLTNPRQQSVIILNPLPSTSNLPITLRSQTVHRQSDIWVLGIRHVIERLRLLRIVSDKERPIKFRSQEFLLLVSKIVAPLYPRFLFPDHLERLIVSDSFERWFHPLQILYFPLEQCKFCLALFDQGRHDMAQ